MRRPRTDIFVEVDLTKPMLSVKVEESYPRVRPRRKTIYPTEHGCIAYLGPTLIICICTTCTPLVLSSFQQYNIIGPIPTYSSLPIFFVSLELRQICALNSIFYRLALPRSLKSSLPAQLQCSCPSPTTHTLFRQEWIVSESIVQRLGVTQRWAH